MIFAVRGTPETSVDDGPSGLRPVLSPNHNARTASRGAAESGWPEPATVHSAQKSQSSMGSAGRATAPRPAVRPVTARSTPRLVAAARSTSAAPPPVNRPPVGAMPTTVVPTAPQPTAGSRKLVLPPVPRVVCSQLALVSGLLAIGRPWWAAAALASSALALFAMSTIRVRGMWLSTMVTRRVRLMARRGPRHLPTGVDGPPALLALLAPGCRVSDTELAGAPVGVTSTPTGLLATLQPMPAGSGDLVRAALCGALMPEPDPEAPRLESHLLLHRGPGQVSIRVWLTVGVLRDVDAADDVALLVPLGDAVRRIVRVARRDGVPLSALTEEEVLMALGALTHTGPGRGTLRETWRCWQAGRVTQVGMRLSSAGTPRTGRVEVLERLLASVPDVAVTVAVATAGRHVSGVLRIAATGQGAADCAADRLTSLGADLGVELQRMDGLHGPAVAASLPIGRYLR